MLCKKCILNLDSEEVHDTVDERQGMGGIAWNKKINRVIAEELSFNFLISGKHSPTDGIGTDKYQDFRGWNCIPGNLQGFRHI